MLGRILLALSATAQIITPYLADFNHTHVYNPLWPPHARFHNGQTMSMGKEALRTAAITGSLYWITGLSGILYPGALAIDPEFGTGFKQLPVFSTLALFSWFGAWWECRGVDARGRNVGKSN
ncbi:hypothetical protein B0J14DRAFT_576377 [Halenospora varia]|nr:hypothetical protein B0J14DRAFT_576377 [Halenospora varia]